jgi:hypothetical protein
MMKLTLIFLVMLGAVIVSVLATQTALQAGVDPSSL